MPYERIRIIKAVTGAERKILEHSDALLADVYTMCSSHPLNRTRAGACNFSAVLVLVCILDALANYIYQPSRDMPVGKDVKQRRFVRLIDDLLPWHSTWNAPDKAVFAEILYLEFRNPLAHEAGRDPAGPSRHRPPGFGEPVVSIWGDVKTRRIGNIDARKSWPEHWPILCADPVLISTATGKSVRQRLTVVALYWAVKHLLRQLSA